MIALKESFVKVFEKLGRKKPRVLSLGNVVAFKDVRIVDLAGASFGALFAWPKFTEEFHESLGLFFSSFELLFSYWEKGFKEVLLPVTPEIDGVSCFVDDLVQGHFIDPDVVHLFEINNNCIIREQGPFQGDTEVFVLVSPDRQI